MKATILFLLLSILYIIDCSSQNINFYQDKTWGDMYLYNKSRGEGGRVLVPAANNTLVINFLNDFSGGTIIGGATDNPVAIFKKLYDPYQLEINGKMKTKSLYASGNVGIGTENPQNKLDVAGTIRAQEVKIEATGWSDFVFAKGYQLPSLSDVEKHIAEKGTLPDIPSEEEVVANGIDVGAMQAKLLQKIEELILYVIELKKENEEQNKLIQQLQKAE